MTESKGGIREETSMNLKEKRTNGMINRLSNKNGITSIMVTMMNKVSFMKMRKINLQRRKHIIVGNNRYATFLERHLYSITLRENLIKKDSV